MTVSQSKISAASNVFPGPVTAARSIWKLLFNIIFGSLFAITGLIITFYSHGNLRAAVFEIAGTIFFGYIALAALPGAASLTLEAKTFTVVRFFRKRTFNWSDVGEFTISKSARLGTPNGVKFADAKRSYIIPDYFNAPTDLCSVLNNWRTAALAKSDICSRPSN